MSDLRKYRRATSAVFGKTTAQWGGLSNMAKGFSLRVNGMDIQSSELLYQAMRFTGYPDVQLAILSQKNPMTGKMIAREHLGFTRPDWEEKRIAIMKWVLCIKLCQNWDTFSVLLLSTQNKDIVEYSKKDPFWGAMPVDYHTLEGTNALGRILMWLRTNCRQFGYHVFRSIPPLELDRFFLLDEPVQRVSPIRPITLVKTYGEQLSLFPETT